MGHTDPVTPVLTEHARERCAEMGITTKVAKRIWRTRRTTRTAHGPGERLLVLSPEFPEYCLVVATRPSRDQSPDGRPLVITVAFNCEDTYVREGDSYRVVA